MWAHQARRAWLTELSGPAPESDRSGSLRRILIQRLSDLREDGERIFGRGCRLGDEQ